MWCTTKHQRRQKYTKQLLISLLENLNIELLTWLIVTLAPKPHSSWGPVMGSVIQMLNHQ